MNKQNDREFFNNIGKQSSDVFYQNEDKAKMAKISIKGNANVMAEQVRANQNQAKKNKTQQRKEAVLLRKKE